MEQLFSFSNLLVMPFWGLMIFLPYWRVTEQLMKSLWVVVPVALLYAALILPSISSVFTGLSSPTLDGIMTFLAEPTAATAAWAHFLAFDLFVGRWVYLDGRSHKISAWFISPILIFVFMLGPIGFLLYLLVRTAVLATKKANSEKLAIH